MPQQDPYLAVLDLLENVRTTGDKAMARCPVHEDSTASLSVGYEHDRVLIMCMAGCDTADVIARLNLGWEDLFSEECKAETKVHEFTYQRPDGTPWMTVERWRRGDGKKSFKQRMTGASEYGLGDNKPALYLLPEVIASAKDGRVIFIAEGESDCHALRTLGVCATTAPMGAGKWRPYFHHWLEGASGVVVVADNDEAGLRGAAQIAADLRGHGFRVSTVVPKEGKDAREHIAAGHGINDFVPIRLNQLRPCGISATALLATEFPEMRWAVEPILPEGLALLGGPPKLSKSNMALDLAVAVASGRSFLDSCGELTGAQGDVLVLALDNDSERRIKQRLVRLLQYQGLLACDQLGIDFHVTWPTAEEAMLACQEWVNDSANPRLIVIDTLIRVEPSVGDDRASYGSTTAAMGRWAQFATDNHVAVLAVHHDRKSNEGNDWLNRFMGSRGITASAATLWMLEAERGSREGNLHITGRDTATGVIPLAQVGANWIVGAEGIPSELKARTTVADVLGSTPDNVVAFRAQRH